MDFNKRTLTRQKMPESNISSKLIESCNSTNTGKINFVPNFVLWKNKIILTNHTNTKENKERLLIFLSYFNWEPLFYGDILQTKLTKHIRPSLSGTNIVILSPRLHNDIFYNANISKESAPTHRCTPSDIFFSRSSFWFSFFHVRGNNAVRECYVTIRSSTVWVSKDENVW